MTNSVKFAIRLVLLTVILLVLSGIGALLIPTTDAGLQAAESATPPAGLLLLVFFCQVLALAMPVLWSRWSGWRLSLAIFAVYFGTVTVVTQVESLIYLGDKMPRSLVTGLFAMGFFVAALFAPVCVLVLGRWKANAVADEDPVPSLNLGRWGWRVAVSGLVFLCLYYLFGYYVAWQDPALREYYGGTDPGSFLAQMRSVVQSTPWMIPLQYLRGLAYVGLGLLVIYSMRGPWWRPGVALSIILAVPALYLLFPNPLMPDFPRMTHLVETLPYQFLFGWFLAWFLVRRTGADSVRPLEISTPSATSR